MRPATSRGSDHKPVCRPLLARGRSGGATSSVRAHARVLHQSGRAISHEAVPLVQANPKNR